MKTSYIQTFSLVGLVSTVAVLFSFVPLVAVAGFWDGIVCAPSGGLYTCNFCHVVDLADAIVKWLVMILAIIFGIIALIAGFKLISSTGNPGGINEAKQMLANALIGLIIVLGSWITINYLMLELTGGTVTIGSITKPWTDIECAGTTQLTGYSDDFDPPAEDINAIAASNPGSYNSGISETCNPGTSNFPACANAPGVVTNENMNPIFDCEGGNCSHMVHSGAEENMAATLAGPYATLQRNFSGTIVVNDAIAKDGTSRETQTTGSRHFHGDALDLSTAGMSDAQKIELFNEAKNAGFTGFGFGNNILHVDTGDKRAWDYGNSTYGGVSVEQLKAEARR